MIATLVVRHYGVEAYAWFSLMVSLPALVQFSDLGSGTALVNTIAASDSPNRDARVRRTLLSCIRITVAFALVCAILAACLAATPVWEMLFAENNAGVLSGGEATWVATVAVFLFAASAPLSLGQRVFVGLGKSHLQSLAQAPLVPLALLGVLIDIYLFNADHAPLLPLSFFVALVITNGVGSFWARRHMATAVDWALQNMGRRSFRGARVMDVGWPMMAQTGLIQVAVMSDRLILSLASTPAQVAEYSLAAQIFGPIGALTTAMAVALWPVFTRKLQRGESLGLPRFSAAFCIATLALGLSLSLISDWVFALLSDGLIAVDGLVIWSYIAATCTQAALYPIGMSMMDANALRFQVKPILASVAVNICLSVLLANAIGAAGPILATAVATLTCQLVPFAIYAHRRSRAATSPA
ncbi:lipopolysaccharide biosynthesis protein [Blastococcus sp. SYSU DS0828]